MCSLMRERNLLIHSSWHSKHHVRGISILTESCMLNGTLNDSQVTDQDGSGCIFRWHPSRGGDRWAGTLQSILSVPSDEITEARRDTQTRLAVPGRRWIKHGGGLVRERGLTLVLQAGSSIRSHHCMLYVSVYVCVCVWGAKQKSHRAVCVQLKPTSAYTGVKVLHICNDILNCGIISFTGDFVIVLRWLVDYSIIIQS